MTEKQYIQALKALADSTRLRLFWLLVKVDQRICVAEAMDVTCDSQYNVSRNLKLLYQAGLIVPQKQGKWVYYTPVEQQQPHWQQLIESVKSIPDNEFCDDINRCKWRLSLRENNECVIGAQSEQWQAILEQQPKV
ncbi:winged helix-turn-helix transcriptional regulator [Shewanella sp. Scap07]|uniref:ArsR/SmtB family transcription factor n=1 Tax=Shewanella sp. Scap07 TaxID=2589987 RepID=UPI0015BAE291|nr:metalloregulator ArsR/SmtB family transcription factor [Shewanella sp. Scap07]QLE86515.1 winged helix-turn-helix transcriptional regulator [Shewanella sp. Scap07]